jgi:hypothetical protein
MAERVGLTWTTLELQHDDKRYLYSLLCRLASMWLSIIIRRLFFVDGWLKGPSLFVMLYAD